MGVDDAGKSVYTYTKWNCQGAGYATMTPAEMIAKYGQSKKNEVIKDGKINEDGIISSNEMITEKEGYEAMLYMLKSILGNNRLK